MSNVSSLATLARTASRALSALSASAKDEAIEAIARALLSHSDAIANANRLDMDDAEQAGLAAPLKKRLLYDASKIQNSVVGLRSLALLPDPVGRTLMSTEMDEGLLLYRVTCPIGVIGVIFESRPDALVQIAALCLKAGNAVLLKGGSEASRTNRILSDIIAEASLSAGIPAGWIALLSSRGEVDEMLRLDESIDLIIPRGSNAFVQHIMRNSSIPVLGHADGVCHVYVNEAADPSMALRIAVDSKVQYVAVCNAAETILIDRSIAANFLPALADALAAKNVVLHGDDEARAIFPMETVDDWHKEYLDYEVSVHIVSGQDEAIDHINRYGSGHTDTIITENKDIAERFLREVDSGSVMWNCSTRFSDGYKYGFGAEVGISTAKIHARGPVGLDGLVTYKYKLYGKGQIVEDYASGRRTFTHRPIPDEGKS